MTKQEFRELFQVLSYYLKMNKFLDKAGISPSNFSRFMKSDVYDDLISIDKLNSLLETIAYVVEDLDLDIHVQ